MTVIQADFTRRNCPVGALVKHPRYGLCPVLQARGLERIIEVVEDGDPNNWFCRRIERVPVTELTEIPTEPA